MKADSIIFNKESELGNLEANLHFLNETLVIDEEVKILEIGSGRGGLLNYLYHQGYDVKGVDINCSRVEESKRLYGNLPLTVVDSEVLPFADNSFDVVMSFDVFEHIPDSNNHLQEVKRVLKDQGVYLLQTPNKFTNVVFETIRWKSLTKWRQQHCSLHNYWETRRRFKENGFEIQFYEISVLTDFFKNKVERHLGSFGLFIINTINPDKLPLYLRTNFYIKAWPVLSMPVVGHEQ